MVHCVRIQIRHRCRNEGHSKNEVLTEYQQYGTCKHYIHMYIKKTLWLHQSRNHVAELKHIRKRLQKSAKVCLFLTFRSIIVTLTAMKSKTRHAPPFGTPCAFCTEPHPSIDCATTTKLNAPQKIPKGLLP